MKMNDWEQVRKWLDDNHTVSARIVEQINSHRYPQDAFSVGQMASKAWLMTHFNFKNLPLVNGITISILGNWIGTLVDPILRDRPGVDRVYGIDTDPNAVILSERLNAHWVQQGWRYKGVVADAEVLDSRQQQFETGGELIQVTPDVIINTSAEHMDNHWFQSASSNQLIVMQTNSNPDLEGHVNICASLEDMKQKYPMQIGSIALEFQMPDYTRFMQIGYADHG